MSLVAYGTGSSSDESDEDEQTQAASYKANSLQNTHSKSAPLPVNNLSPPASSSFETDSVNELDDYDPISLPAATSSIFGKLPEPINHIQSLHSFNEIPTPHQKFGAKGLFASLPSPKNSSVPNKTDAGPSKKTVKIMAPPLRLQTSENSDEEVPKKKSKPSSQGSGLFSLLPAPRNITTKETNRPLVPHVLTKKVPTPSVKPLPQKTPKPATESLKLMAYGDSGDDSEEESGPQKDYFSLDTNTEPDILLPSVPPQDDIPYSSATVEPNVEEEISNDQPLAFVSGFQPSPWSAQPGPSWQVHEDQSDAQGTSMEEDYLSIVEDDLQLDDEALERLCGRRAKKHKQPVEVINVSGAEIMPDPKEWLIKQLSEEQPRRRSHSHKKNDGPTSQQRRKHQITYLAFQAKENELELKNQWSQNRVSRKQTQSKYGF